MSQGELPRIVSKRGNQREPQRIQKEYGDHQRGGATSNRYFNERRIANLVSEKSSGRRRVAPEH
jgi:hypothetical protein